MIIAAALCPSPPLLIPGLTGAAGVVLPDLRAACEQAAVELVAARPDVIAVVGASERTATWDGDVRLDVTVFAPGLGAAPTAAANGLPASLGVGSWLLDQVGYRGDRQLHGIAPAESAQRCARIGADLAATPGRIALLVLADGSACRNPKAPGYFDERSAGFDAEVERAVRTGDLAALLSIDAGVAAELLATGRTGWQVLAGALNGTRVRTEIRYCDDPFGVAYLVASLRAIRPKARGVRGIVPPRADPFPS